MPYKRTEIIENIIYLKTDLVGVGLILMFFTRHLPSFLLMRFIYGFASMSTVPICNTIVQTTSSSEMLGRVVVIFAMSTLGTLPLGSFFIGWLAKTIGAQHCQLAQGIICIIIASCFYNFLKSANYKT